ncbi:hypothetical protein EAO75_00545 [Streptomyces sp. uw30]|nr:hypothetical protein EAO75_00545 [Streptomyces sp. uw30]
MYTGVSGSGESRTSTWGRTAAGRWSRGLRGNATEAPRSPRLLHRGASQECYSLTAGVLSGRTGPA